MRSSTAIRNTNLDTIAAQMIVEYRCSDAGNTGGSADKIISPGVKFCHSVTLVSGEQYSFAWIGIPINKSLDEIANQVALRMSGPTGKVRPLSRGAIFYYENGRRVQVFAGCVGEYGHDVYSDSANGFLIDDKWLMDKVVCHGRQIWDPRPATQPQKDKDGKPPTGTQQGGVYYFDSGEPLVFNAGGIGDCMDSPQGPRFSPSIGFGRSSVSNAAGYKEPAVGNARTSARSWQVSDMLRYLCDVHARGMAHSQGGHVIDQLDRNVFWTPSLGSGITGFNRIKRNFDIDGCTLLRAVGKILRAAGAYDLFMRPYGFYSYMCIVNMNPSHTSGTILYLPGSYVGNTIEAVANNASMIVHGGSVKESAINYYSSVQIVGDCPVLELECAFLGVEVPTDKLGEKRLEPAWTIADEEAFLRYVLDNGDSQSAFEGACQIWPWVYNAYRIVGSQIPWKDTKWSNCTSHGHPRIRESLITMPPGANTNNINDWIPLQYTWEYLDNYGSWQEAEPSDGMQLTPDRRIICLPGLRKQEQTFMPKDYSINPYKSDNIKARPLRATLAVEAEWPITGKSGQGEGNGNGDPNGVGNLVSKERYFTYSCVSLPGDYSEWLRHTDSRPEGTLTIEPFKTTMWPAAMTEGKELYTDRTNKSTGRLPNHAKVRLTDVARIEFNGFINLQSLNVSLLPGTNIQIRGDNCLPVISVVKSLTIDTNKQNVTIELTSHDRQTIYDNQQGSETSGQVLPEEKAEVPPERKDDGSIETTEEKQAKKQQESMAIYDKPENQSRGDQVNKLLSPPSTPAGKPKGPTNTPNKIEVDDEEFQSGDAEKYKKKGFGNW